MYKPFKPKLFKFVCVDTYLNLSELAIKSHKYPQNLKYFYFINLVRLYVHYVPYS